MNEILEAGFPGIAEQDCNADHQDDPVVLTMEDDQKLSVSGLNPILLSIWYKS